MPPMADETARDPEASVPWPATGARQICDRLSDPAILVDVNHRILSANRSFQDSYGSEGSLSGETCYEVLHEFVKPCHQAGVFCPMEQCRETRRTARGAHTHRSVDGMKQEEIICLPLEDDHQAIRHCILVVRESAVMPPDKTDPPDGLVGRSAAFNIMMELASRVADSDIPVLLVGESGTGKELVASLIHRLSSRSSHAMIPVDCSGMAESIIESELYGHEKGAFTGAVEQRPGLFEMCNRGTLFLDEVSNIPLSLQAKLLRVLESGTFRRVGSSTEQHSDFRLICATNHDLAALVEKGTFRHDLYQRISTFPIVLPPLRERFGDLAMLSQALIRRIGCRDGCAIEDQAMAALERYSFPGNVRELLNILSRACVLAEGGVLRLKDLPSEVRAQAADQEDAKSGDLLPLREHEDRYLRWAAAAVPGGVRELARQLNVSERTLYRKLKRAGSLPAQRTSNPSQEESYTES